MYGIFLNPASASAEQAGVFLVFGLAAFGLLLLSSTLTRRKPLKKGGVRTKRPKTPQKKAVLVMGGVLAGLLLIMVLGMCMERI